MTIRESTAVRISIAVGLAFAFLSVWVHSFPGFHADVFGRAAAAVIGFGVGFTGALTLLWLVFRRPRPSPVADPDDQDDVLDVLTWGHR
jgi:hypothetical protein